MCICKEVSNILIQYHYTVDIVIVRNSILTAVNFLVVSNLHEEEVESGSSAPTAVGGGGYVAVAETGTTVL